MSECQHPRERIYTWIAYDGTLCAGCCDCGAVLAGAAPRASEVQEGTVEIQTVTLTTDHAASSYGVPVAVIDGEVYGPADMTPAGVPAAVVIRAFAARFCGDQLGAAPDPADAEAYDLAGVDVPDMDQLQEWMDSGICEALDGCIVEPDGHCPHGQPSWCLHLGLI